MKQTATRLRLLVTPLFALTMMWLLLVATTKSVMADDSLDCNVFDVTIILDRSSSITAESWQKNVEFTKALTTRFKSPLTRYSIYSFSASCQTELQFTNNANDIQRVASALQQGHENGTNVAICLRAANADLQARTVKNVPLYVIVTDGEENVEVGQGKAETDRARDFGVQVYVVHVGKTVENGTNTIKAMANKPLDLYTFDIQDYFELATTKFITQLVSQAESSCLVAYCENGYSVVHVTVNSSVVTSGSCNVYDDQAFSVGIAPNLLLASVPATKESNNRWACTLPTTLAPQQYALTFASGDGIQRAFSAVNVVSCSSAEIDTFCLSNGTAIVRAMLNPVAVVASTCRIFAASAFTSGSVAGLTPVASVAAVHIGTGQEWRCSLPASLAAGQYSLSFEAAGVQRSLTALSVVACATTPQTDVSCTTNGSSLVRVSMQQYAGMTTPTCRVYDVAALTAPSTAGLTPLLSLDATVVGAGQWQCIIPSTVAVGSYAFVFEAAGVQRVLTSVRVLACGIVDTSVVCNSEGTTVDIHVQQVGPIQSATCRIFNRTALTATSLVGLPVLATVNAVRYRSDWRCVLPSTLAEAQYALSFEGTGLVPSLSLVNVITCASVQTAAFCAADGVSVVAVTLVNVAVHTGASCAIFPSLESSHEIATVPAVANGVGAYRCLMPFSLEARTYTMRFMVDGVQRAVSDIAVLFCATVQAQSFCYYSAATINVTMTPLPTLNNAQCVLYNNTALTTGNTSGLTPFATLPAVPYANGEYRCAVPETLPAITYALVFVADGVRRSLAPMKLLSCGKFDTQMLCVNGASVIQTTMTLNPIISNGRCLVYPAAALNASSLTGFSTAASLIAFTSGNGQWRCSLPVDMPVKEYTFVLTIDDKEVTRWPISVVACATVQIESACVVGNGATVLLVKMPQTTSTLSARCALYPTTVVKRTEGVTGVDAIASVDAVKLTVNDQWRCSLPTSVVPGDYVAYFTPMGQRPSMNAITVSSCAQVQTATYCWNSLAGVNITVSPQPIINTARCLLYNSSAMTAPSTADLTAVANVEAIKDGPGQFRCALPATTANTYTLSFETDGVLRSRSLVNLAACATVQSHEVLCVNETVNLVTFTVSNPTVIADAQCLVSNSTANGGQLVATVNAQFLNGSWVCLLPSLPVDTYTVTFVSAGVQPYSFTALITICAPLLNETPGSSFPYWSLFFLIALIPILAMVAIAYRSKKPEQPTRNKTIEMQNLSPTAAPATAAAPAAEAIPPPPPPADAAAAAPVAAAAAAATPTKKWAAVDTSKYVWSRDGGTARPMPVKWGDLGATEFGTHLEAIGDKEVFNEKGSLDEKKTPAADAAKPADAAAPEQKQAAEAFDGSHLTFKSVPKPRRRFFCF